MKRVLWLVLVCLMTAVLVLSACTQGVPEAPLTPSPAPVAEPSPAPAPAPVPVPAPSPPPAPVPSTSDDDWGLWGPLKWPEEYKATKGARLDFVKKEEVTVGGKPAIIYFLVAVGLPRDKVYRLWVKSLSNPTPTELNPEMGIDSSDYVTSGQSRFQLGVQAPAKGEAMEFALMTVDKTTGALGKIISYPIESKQGPYRLWVELRSKKGDLFAIHGEGFEANEEVNCASTSNGEAGKWKSKADGKGRLYVVALPAVVGKESGLATLTVLGKHGEVKVSYQWGTEATKTTPPSTPPPTKTQTPPLPPLDAFMKGFNFNDWAPFDKLRPPNVGPLYYPPHADWTLKNLAATGTNWIRLLVNVEQETFSSTEVKRSQYGTPTDSALLHVIDYAHSLGMRVGFNINIQFSNDPTHYRPQIGSAFTTEAQWQAWFASYKEIVLYYAALAQDAGVDMFAIGYELGATTHREADWRNIAQEVRQVYKGPILYSASTRTNSPLNEELRIKWWDAMDYIGVEPYFPLTDKTNPTVEEVKAAWVQKGYVSRFENLSKQFQKPIIITEIGYLAQDGTNMLPSMTAFKARFPDAPLDLQEQADCYQAAFEVFWGKPWLKGIFWWQWLANPMWWPGGPNDKYEFPYGKPAEEVLKKFYLSK